MISYHSTTLKYSINSRSTLFINHISVVNVGTCIFSASYKTASMLVKSFLCFPLFFIVYILSVDATGKIFNFCKIILLIIKINFSFMKQSIRPLLDDRLFVQKRTYFPISQLSGKVSTVIFSFMLYSSFLIINIKQTALLIK